MNQLRGTLKGVVTALGTPLDRNEDLHEKGMRKQIRMQLAAGVDGLLVLGSMGCMQMLKDEVFVEAVEVAVDEVRGAVPVIVGCGDTSTERTLARIRLSENYPLAGVALIPPFIFRFSQAELHEYFTGVASRTSLPVYPYDNPALTGHSLEHELVRKLAEHSNIVGLKASGDFLTFRQSAEHFRDSDLPFSPVTPPSSTWLCNWEPRESSRGSSHWRRSSVSRSTGASGTETWKGAPRPRGSCCG